jgi:hypothetical protein
MTIHTARENALTAAQKQADLELYEAELSEEPKLCESPYCNKEMRRPPHPADWWARNPCWADGTGEIDQVCEFRRMVARQQGGWWCRPGCGILHSYPRIQWMPIPGRTP